MFFGKPLKNMSPREVKIGMEQGDVVLVDVREPNEWKGTHIEGAHLVPLSEFEIGKLPCAKPEQTIVLQCAGGMRSAQAVRICQKAGMTNVANMAGGISAWIQNGFAVTSAC